MKIATFVLIALTLLACQPKASDNVLHVAVASNFYAPAKLLAAQFAEKTGVEVELSAGSTGQLYTQIVQGAPFDVFLAADVARPVKLEEQNLIVANSRFTYASGRLVLWSLQQPIDDDSNLKHLSFEHLAIANPKLAPYGVAAVEAMQFFNVWDDWQERLVFGQNISQTQQFVVAGQAQFAIISWSQALLWQQTHKGDHFILLPENSHSVIAQQGVQLTAKQGGADFLTFLRSESVIRQLKEWGYEVEQGREEGDTP